LYSLERLLKLSNQIIVSKVAINKAAADLQTTLLSQVVVTPTKISREPQSIVQTPRAKIVITFYLGLVILSYLSWWLLGNRKEKVKIVKRPMTEKAIIPRFDAQLPVALVSNKVVNDSQFDLHSVVRKVLNEIIENSIDQGVLLTLSGTGPLMIKGDRQKAVVETQNILTSVISNVSRYSIHKKVKIILKQEVGEIIFEIRYSPNDPEVFFEAIKDSIQCKPHFGKMTSKKLYDENGLLLFTGVNVRAPISSPRLAM
jgi:hypothetical protein